VNDNVKSRYHASGLVAARSHWPGWQNTGMAQQFDTSVPNIARVYDFWLGGKDNFAADRELAAQLTTIYPPIAQMIWDNRQFLARAVSWVAQQGISQFIDLGPGLPTSPSTHEAARAVRSGTKVAYVDFDPLVVSHLDALVANGQDGIVVMSADVRDRDAVLNAPALAGHIDLTQPACLIMGAVLHFLEAEAAAELAASYARILAPGSYVILTVGRGDGEVADRFFSMYRAAARMHSHSLDQFATFFQGLEIVPPGLLLAEQWQPDLQRVRPVPKRPGEVLVGVAKVPARPLLAARRLSPGRPRSFGPALAISRVVMGFRPAHARTGSWRPRQGRP
jgi:O-methyltransferase involved in polyketide biosynthesis